MDLASGYRHRVRNLRRRRELCEAAKIGDFAAIKSLVARKADLGKIGDHMGRNVLHLAAAAGRTECVIRLLDSGLVSSVIDDKDANGDTPIALAAKLKFMYIAAKGRTPSRVHVK